VGPERASVIRHVAERCGPTAFRGVLDFDEALALVNPDPTYDQKGLRGR